MKNVKVKILPKTKISVINLLFKNSNNNLKKTYK